MRRRKTAVLLVLTALLAAGFLLWGNCSLQTTETALVSPALPPAFDGLRIVELADLHGRVFGRGSRRLLAAVRRAEPDLICIDGDLFDEHTDLAMLPPLLRGLCAIAPVYYVTGNHEWRVPGLRGILAQMRACGVTVLQDDWRVLRRGEDALVLAGTDDPCGPAERKTPAELIADIRAEAGEAAFLLLLAHRNDQLPQWSALGVRHGPAAVPRMGCRALPAGRNGPVCQPRAWLYKRALSPVQPAGGRGDRSAPGQPCNKFVNKS